ncbi:MAG: NUDIX domain-containing protein [Phycisphaerales bacterium]
MSDARSIEVIARGVVVHEGCVLLCRSLRHGYAYLPGGHVEFGEQAARALEREFEEEVGLPVRVGRCLLVTEEHFDAGGVRHHEINIVFHVEQLGESAAPPTDVPSREDKIGFEWVHLAALHETDLRPATIKAWLMAGQTDATAWVSGMD